MLIFSNSLSIDYVHFFETDSISFSSNSSEIVLLRDYNGNKAYNLVFLYNSYHQLSAVKDIVSYFLVFYCWVYIFKTVCKIIDGEIYLLTYLLTNKINKQPLAISSEASIPTSHDTPTINHIPLETNTKDNQGKKQTQTINKDEQTLKNQETSIKKQQTNDTQLEWINQILATTSEA